ncbi:MAG: hypothetical protein N4A33_10100 [Bacteriovoracaceae bacterium]|jgi:hypothetical protein|nr:hypothetical protein [Bacteriovoracaceae bacterium]
MDGIKQQIHAKQQASIEKKHEYDVKRLNRELRDELNEMKDKNKSTIVQVRKDYNRSEMDEKNRLEMQLSKIRISNDRQIKEENQRYEKMLEELKNSHEQMITELKISQEKEYGNKKQEHEDALDLARRKYMAKMQEYKA